MTTRAHVLSAKVDADLRTDYELLAQRAGHGDLSVIVRNALVEYRDRILRAPDLDSIPTSGRTSETPEQRHARLKVEPRAGTQRFAALVVYERRGANGATADEVLAELERVAHYQGSPPPAANGVARRVADLLEAGFIEGTREHRVTRPTRHGAPANVYVITTAGAHALEASRTKARHADRGQAAA